MLLFKMYQRTIYRKKNEWKKEEIWFMSNFDVSKLTSVAVSANGIIKEIRFRYSCVDVF